MVAFRAKITKFGGMVPATDSLLLPDNAASYAQNTWLYDGDLRGYRPDVYLRTLVSSTAKRVFRIPNDYTARPTSTFSNSTWMEFQDENTDVVRSPVVGDLYGRYYWASPSLGANYNSLARIQAGNASYTLGVPSPGSAPGLTSDTGTSTVTVTRAYVFTWLTGFGEEGAPSAPAILTGKQDDVWHVTCTAPTTNQNTGHNLTTVRIYRTVTSSAGVATYFLVAEQAIGTLTYADSQSDTVVSAGSQITSTNWNEPPAGLQGMIAMPNGIIAGWTVSDIYFCEPYRPHAWPALYSLSVDAPVVGLGVFGNSLVVCTTGHTTIISGVHPAQMTQATLPTLEPCVSRGSILATQTGVAYAGQNGLVMVVPGAVSNLTEGVVTREMWRSEVDPYQLRAVRLGTAYFALHAPQTSPGTGIVYDPQGMMSFSWFGDGNTTKNVQSDMWTGDIFTIHDGAVYQLNPPVETGMNTYTWTSKLFQMTAPTNLAAAKIVFTVPSGSPTLNPVANTSLVQTLASDQYALFQMYADGTLVYTRELRTSGQVFALPSGFKALQWQFKITSRVTVTSVEIAESVKDLKAV